MSFDTPIQRRPVAPVLDTRAVAMQLRTLPRFNDLVAILRDDHARALNEYITSPASEFNRGRVLQAAKTLKFFETGEL